MTVVLGWSGLPRAKEVRRAAFPDIDERQLAFVQGIDSASAIVVDGEVVAAAAEERFARTKHTGAFPVNAIRYCLAEARLSLDRVDRIAHAFRHGATNPFARLGAYYRDRFDKALADTVQLELLQAHFPDPHLEQRFRPVPHHLAHAASAYFASGLEPALVLVSDGLGELESATVALGEAGRLRVLATIPASHSLGVLYGLVTHYLGFWFNSDEYKVMGLAPYGDPARFRDVFFERFVQLRPDGRYAVPALSCNRSVRERETYAGTLAALTQAFGPMRAPGAPLEQRHMDVAAAMQAVLEETQLHLLRHFSETTGLARLALAGGVALNCTANGRILRSGLFEQVYVYPAAGDDGSALGAALFAFQEETGTLRPRRHPPPLLGAAITAAEVDACLAGRHDVRVTAHANDDSWLEAVANLIAAGRIVAWAHGRMEFGPRALGSRSILADPRDAAMRDRINRLVKKREEFRPFAPAVLAEAAPRLFTITPERTGVFDSMLFITDVRPEYRARLPAITHVDGSARVQTVEAEDHPTFYSLIERVGRRTGVPVVLNTSFNVSGQPIVRTAQEALDTFLAAGLDALAMERRVILPLGRCRRAEPNDRAP